MFLWRRVVERKLTFATISIEAIQKFDYYEQLDKRLAQVLAIEVIEVSPISYGSP